MTKKIKFTQDQMELHNALIGIGEQLEYIKWLCGQLGYIQPRKDK